MEPAAHRELPTTAFAAGSSIAICYLLPVLVTRGLPFLLATRGLPFLPVPVTCGVLSAIAIRLYYCLLFAADASRTQRSRLPALCHVSGAAVVNHAQPSLLLCPQRGQFDKDCSFVIPKQGVLSLARRVHEVWVS